MSHILCPLETDPSLKLAQFAGDRASSSGDMKLWGFSAGSKVQPKQSVKVLAMAAIAVSFFISMSAQWNCFSELTFAR